MMFKVSPYKMGSRSATALAQALNTKKVYPDGNYRPRRGHVVINWGSSAFPGWHTAANVAGCRILNYPDRIKVASNKLLAFQRLAMTDVTIPEWTTERATAQIWLDADDGTKVVERHKLTGHSGDGIAIKEFGQDIAPAPLYTKYMLKADEYRVHVMNGEVFDVQQKRKRQDVEDADYQVRNHQNGWVYCREELNAPEGINELAIAAIEALGLDFGGVDIIYNRRRNQLTVLEVNTACGLEGTTLTNYVDSFKGQYNV